MIKLDASVLALFGDSESIFIDHETCGGVDTLFLKKILRGIECYCVNCNENAYYETNIPTSLDRKIAAAGDTHVRSLPMDLTFELPDSGDLMLQEYSISDNFAVQRYKIGYSDMYKSLILPLYERGNVSGFQAVLLGDLNKPSEQNFYFSKYKASFLTANSRKLYVTYNMLLGYSLNMQGKQVLVLCDQRERNLQNMLALFDGVDLCTIVQDRTLSQAKAYELKKDCGTMYDTCIQFQY